MCEMQGEYVEHVGRASSELAVALTHSSCYVLYSSLLILYVGVVESRIYQRRCDCARHVVRKNRTALHQSPLCDSTRMLDDGLCNIQYLYSVR